MAQWIQPLSGKREYPSTLQSQLLGDGDRGTHRNLARWISGIDELWAQEDAQPQEIKWGVIKEDTCQPLYEYTNTDMHTHLHICSTHMWKHIYMCTHIQSRSKRKHIKMMWNLWGVVLSVVWAYLVNPLCFRMKILEVQLHAKWFVKTQSTKTLWLPPKWVTVFVGSLKLQIYASSWNDIRLRSLVSKYKIYSSPPQETRSHCHVASRQVRAEQKSRIPLTFWTPQELLSSFLWHQRVFSWNLFYLYHKNDSGPQLLCHCPELLQGNACLACVEPWASPQHQINRVLVWGSGVQGHLPLCGEFQASLNYTRPHIK